MPKFLDIRTNSQKRFCIQNQYPYRHHPNECRINSYFELKRPSRIWLGHLSGKYRLTSMATFKGKNSE